MNTHPVKTKTILEKFHFPRNLRAVPEIAGRHHEKVNGKGYPDGLTGDRIPLGSKIIAVADVFDALTSRREYPKYDGGQDDGSGGHAPDASHLNHPEGGREATLRWRSSAPSCAASPGLSASTAAATLRRNMWMRHPPPGAGVTSRHRRADVVVGHP